MPAPAKAPSNVRVYRPNPSAVPFHESTAKIKALCGPVGSGKSSAACLEFFLLCYESPMSVRGLVLRETYRQLTDSTRRTWEEWFGYCSRYVKSDERYEITIPGADGVVRTHYLDLRHARRVEDAQAFLSTEYAFIWFEEPVPAFEVGQGIVGGGIPQEVYSVALTRLRQAGVHRRHLVLTFNPPTRFHWIYRMFFEPTPIELNGQGMALFRQPARENAKHLEAGYYDLLSRNLDPVLVQRFVEGEPVTIYPGVRVYPDCHQGVHIVDDLEPTEGVPIVTGHDWGLTPVALFGQVLPSGRLLLLKELQLWNSGAKKLIEVMVALLNDPPQRGGFAGYKIARSWGDPAGNARSETDESTCFSLMGQAGFPITAGAMTFTERREGVTERLRKMIDGKPAILIDSRGCPLLAEGMMGGYRYPESRDGQVMFSPLKNEFSHVVNALEYMVTGEFNLYSTVAPQRDTALQVAKAVGKWNPLTSNPRRGPRTWMSR